MTGVTVLLATDSQQRRQEVSRRKSRVFFVLPEGDEWQCQEGHNCSDGVSCQTGVSLQRRRGRTWPWPGVQGSVDAGAGGCCLSGRRLLVAELKGTAVVRAESHPKQTNMMVSSNARWATRRSLFVLGGSAYVHWHGSADNYGRYFGADLVGPRPTISTSKHRQTRRLIRGMARRPASQA